MFSIKKPNQSGDNTGVSRKMGILRTSLKSISPEELSFRTGSVFLPKTKTTGVFQLRLYDNYVFGQFPEFFFQNASGDVLPEMQQLLLLYYFSTADGSSLSGKFVSFADLPDGRMYGSAFQGYSGDEIIRSFGVNLVAFKDACSQENGEYCQQADAAFTFSVLPKISVQINYWLGDDEFPSSCKILFDSAVTHYVPIDACAIIGSHLVRRIIKRASNTKSGDF